MKAFIFLLTSSILLTLQLFSQERYLYIDSIPPEKEQYIEFRKTIRDYIYLYEDRTNELTIEEVSLPSFQNSFMPKDQFKEFDYKYSYWAKISFDIGEADYQNVLLSIHGSDYFEVYMKREGKFLRKNTGYLVPSSENDEIYFRSEIIVAELESFADDSVHRASIFIRFHDKFKGGHPEIYMDISDFTTGSFIVIDSLKRRYKRNFLSGIIQGIFILMFLFSALIFFIQKKPESLFYAFYILFMAFTIRFTEEMLLKEFRDFNFTAQQFVSISSFLFYILFLKAILEIDKTRKRFIRLTKFTLWGFPVFYVGIILFVHVLKDLYLYNISISLLAGLLFIILFYVNIVLLFDKNILNKLFARGSVILFLSFLYFILYINFDLPYAFLVMKLGVLAQILIYAYLLIINMRRNEKLKIETQEKLLIQLRENEKLQTKVNRELEQRVKERTIEIEHQKEEIAAQRDEIEAQRDMVLEQKDEIEEIHQHISDSIDYATRIQSSILPNEHILEEHLSDHFVYYLPKDRVSGDFYWWSHIEGHTVITAADCTGHGVPGAFMSMLGVSFLREIVNKEYITHPGVILRRLRKEIVTALRQKGGETGSQDGMDMALISINHDTGKMQFAGANNPLYLIRKEKLNIDNDKIVQVDINGEIKDHYFYEIKPDRMPIAIYLKMDKFSTHEIELQKGDHIYMFSDGFADQFGGPKERKFKYKPFKQILFEHINQSMTEQKAIIEKTFNDWKGEIEQVDDVVVLGIKI